MTATRQLAAIMFTDIVGYTAIMQENEKRAVALRQRHREVFKQEHTNHHGNVLQYYGDGTLSIFRSAVEAVECAISMQQQFLSGDPLPLRIGIHLGDIVFDENDVYGDGVNLASRVESMGVPGCILISDKVQYAVKNHSGISTISRGFFEFKNVKEPVEIFAVTNSIIKVPERSELKGKLKQNKKSIAVLPFVNMSSDAENEYFSDGISEEILNALTRVQGLSVTARTSSFAFKGKNIDVREIGTQLGVAHILEGSVRKAGNRVRITAQLVSTIDGYHFFSETYERTLEDIFQVQDEIASTIVNRLREHLGEKEYEEKLVTASTLNIEAYETYLKGLYYSNKFADDKAMKKAIPYFEKAVEMQPDFVLPYERLIICYFFQSMGGGMSPEESRTKMTSAYEKLIGLGSLTANGYFAVCVYNIFVKWNFVTAAKVVKEGLKKFPNAASLFHIVSTLFWIKGDLPSTNKVHQIGLQRDPLSIEMIYYMGASYQWISEFDKATECFNKVLVLVPEHRAAKEYLGWIAAFKGNHQEALEIFKTLEPFGYQYHQSTCLGWTYSKMGELEKTKRYLEELKTLHTKSPQGFKLVIDLSVLYICLGDFDNAFHYLEIALTHKVGSIMMFKEAPLFAPLKSDPRFDDMVKILGKVPDVNLEELLKNIG